MYVKWRDETNKDLGYFLMEEDGSEILQAHVTEDQKVRARRRKTSFDAIILEDHAAKLGREKPEGKPHREVKVVRVENTPHDHDDRYLLALPEHEHPPLEHEHPHTHAELGELRGEMKAHEASNLEAFRLTDKALIEHGHPNLAPIVHQHADLSAAISDLGVRVKALDGHKHDEVAWHEHQDTDAKIARIQNDLLETNKRIAENANELRTLIAAQAESFKAELAKLAPLEHEHDGLVKVTAFESHVADVANKTDLHVLSTQEVAGKTRLVVEEVQ